MTATVARALMQGENVTFEIDMAEWWGQVVGDCPQSGRGVVYRSLSRDGWVEVAVEEPVIGLYLFRPEEIARVEP